MIAASFNIEGTQPDRREVLIICDSRGQRAGGQVLIRGVGIGSSRQVVDLDFKASSVTVCSVTGEKADKELILVGGGVVIG